MARLAANVDYLIKLRSGELRDLPTSSQSALPDPDEALAQVVLRLAIRKRRIDVYTMIDSLATDISSLLPVLDMLERRNLIKVDRSEAHGNYTITPTEPATSVPRF